MGKKKKKGLIFDFLLFFFFLGKCDDFHLNKNYKAFFFRNEGNLKNKKQKQKNYFGVYRYLHLGV